MAAHLKILAGAAWVVFLSAPVQAQTLADPTRPAGVAASQPAAHHEQISANAQVQSILISPQRRVAIVNGESVQAGDMLGDAKVVRITENEVVLRTGSEIRILKMYPGVEKTSVAAAAAKATSKHKQ